MFNHTPYLQGVANVALAKGLRVKWHSTAGEFVLAGDEACVGTVLSLAQAGKPVTVVDIRTPGSLEFVAGGAIALGAAFTSAAAGKVVTGTGGVEDYGVALTAPGGDLQHFQGTSAQ